MVRDSILKILKRLPNMFIIIVIILACSSLIRTGSFSDINWLLALAMLLSFSLIDIIFDYYKLEGICRRKRK